MQKPKSFTQQIKAALKGWYKNSESTKSLLTNLQLVMSEVVDRNSLTQLRFQTNRVLANGITALEQQNPVAAEILQKRFRDNETIAKVAVMLGLSDDQINRRQREAIDLLSNVIWGQEVALRQRMIANIESSVPPATYKGLFGLNRQLQEIVANLLDPNALPVVVISGIGGIGKTSLADAAVRQIIPKLHFNNVIWQRVDATTISGDSVTPEFILDVVSAELIRKLQPTGTEQLTRDERHQRIRAILNQSPYLVVIDNIETNADTGVLLQHLTDWAGVSKFLVTTRTRLTGQRAVLAHDLTELSPADAKLLVSEQAQERNLHDFADHIDEVFADIYELAGGNPLALKLVVSLLSFMPLSHILNGLRSGGKADDINQMYARIYRQAWQTLGHDARELLQAMPLVGEEGGDIEQLQEISEVPQNAIWAAITALVNRSLIEVRGDFRERLYGVHRLTMTFLQTEIIGGDFGFS